jgi:proteasome lid subunit RPN8/RPN11
MENMAENRIKRFAVNPSRQIEEFKAARECGELLVGIVHSHIETNAYPSKKDIDSTTYPEAFYVIISICRNLSPQVKAFKIIEGKVKEYRIIHYEQ